MRQELPFERGNPQTESGAFDHLLGKEYTVDDIDWSSTEKVKPHRSGADVTLRLVKNGSTAAILPTRVCKYSTTAGEYGKNISGMTAVLAEDWAGVADEALPAAGAPVNSYFYIVVDGPSLTYTPMAGADAVADFTVGGLVVCATAAASTGTTAGRVAAQTIGGATAPLANNVQNAVGRALSAATTGNTNTALLVDVKHF